MSGVTFEYSTSTHADDIGGVATVVRRAAWSVYKDCNTEVRHGQGYATGTAPNYTYTLVNPVSITKFDKSGNVTEEISATRSSTSGKLTAGDSFPQTSYVRWTTHQYTECCKLASTRLYHLIPGSGAGVVGNIYQQTDFGYDIRNRRNRVVSPGGTITKQVFDARSLPTQVLVGTSDANLVAVAEYEYDSGTGGGDGNLTKETQHVDGLSAGDRVTSHAYDWRNRRTSTDGEIDFYQKSYFDNFDRVVKSERYDTTSSGNLISRSETKYDDLGRVFRTVRYAVDPATGSVGNSLTDDTWYDAAGHVIKHFPAGSKAFAKSVFDGLGRETKQYVGYDTDETSYSDAGNVTGDTIFEQVETSYDAASNVIQTTVRRRFHNATGTGELTTPSGSQPKARVSYVALYPDAVGRQQAVGDYGTNGGSAFSRPSTIPARSDTVLVTSTEYNSDGEGFKTIDPMGTQTRQEFDDAGRQTKLIENYIDGDPATGTSDQDRTTITGYNADGQVKTLTAKNPTTGDQVTKYVYGSTLAESGLASSQLLRAVIYPDSDDGDAPLGNGPDGIYDRMEYKYNRQGERVELKDQRETVHVYDHDKLGRMIHDRVTELGSPFGTPVFSSSSSGSSSSSSPTGSSSSSSSGPAHVVDGSVRRISRTYEVRGMLKNVTSHDNPTVGAGNVVNDVEFVYNTFGQLVTEYQEHAGPVSTSTTPKVQYAYATGSANHVRRTKMTYPNSRILRYEYNSGADDNLGRISFLADDNAGAVGTHLAEYSYLGLGTIVQVDYTEPDIRYDLVSGSGADPYDGLDRFDRVVDCLWRNYGTSTEVERIKHGYDRASNRLWRENTVAPAGFDELYSYDGLYQLKDFDRGDLNAGKTAITGLTFAQEWSLDATGNWSAFKEDTDGNGSWDLNQSRSHNKVNEISTIGASAGPDWADPVHDRAGNMVLIPQPADPTQSYSATWDAWNRLVKLTDGMTTVGQYAYDGGARRTKKLVSGTTRHFYHSALWQVLEERLGSSSSADRQFVWGLRYVDNLVLRDRDADGNAGTGDFGISASGLEERLYGLQDSNWNITSVVDGSGSVQERYGYGAYGIPAVFSSAFGSRLSSLYDWETLYASYRWDSELGLYSARFRVYSASIGRWTSRDPVAPLLGSNVYDYVSGNAVGRVDPTGEGIVVPIAAGLGVLIGIGGAQAIQRARTECLNCTGKRSRDARFYAGEGKKRKCVITIELVCRKMPEERDVAGTQIFRHCFLAIKKGGKYIGAVSGMRDDVKGSPTQGRTVYTGSAGDRDWDLREIQTAPYKVYPLDIGKNTDPCCWIQCAHEYAQELSGQYGYYQYVDNSNTFVTRIIRQCGGVADFPWTATASDDIPFFPVRAGAAPLGCFAGTTPVAAPSGTVQMDSLSPANEVYAFDIERACLTPVTVRCVSRRSATSYYEVEVGDEIIVVTGEHPFCVVGGGWVRVRDLCRGSILLSVDGRPIAVADVRKCRGGETVYQLTVDAPHTFVVGNSRVVVHNKFF